MLAEVEPTRMGIRGGKVGGLLEWDLVAACQHWTVEVSCCALERCVGKVTLREACICKVDASPDYAPPRRLSGTSGRIYPFRIVR